MLALTKQSDENSIRQYFEKIIELQKSGEPFPCDLDMVWGLVYSEKGKAVRVLKELFFENDDYQVFAQNGKNTRGGRKSNEIMLSVACMEYLIARKVRPVFEVYRKVFHQATNDIATLSQANTILASIQAMQVQQVSINKHEEKIAEIENKIASIEQKQAIEIKQDYFTILAYCRMNNKTITFSEAIQKGKIATRLSKEKGFELRKTSDERYGYVNSYKESILKETFQL